MPLSNRWNRFVYRLWSPVYDAVFDRLFAAPGRRKALDRLAAQPGERLLLAGVGTGADLPLLPAGVSAVGVDLSPEMLARARRKLPLAGRVVSLIQGDAQALPLAAGSCDAVVLNLVLSVVPDGGACWREAWRAVKPGGRIVVFDKFAPEAGRPSPGRRLLNVITEAIGTDITRQFESLTAGAPYRLISDEPGLLGGAYRVIVCRKETEAVA